MTWRQGDFLVILLGMAVTSCAQLAPPPPIAGVLVTEAREDSTHRFMTFIGPKAQHAPAFLGIPETNFYCLRSFVDRQTGESAHQLYVTDSYFGNERGWNAARDSSGAPLLFVAIGHDEITCDAGCSYAEEFAAKLPESVLRASPNGLAVAFSSRSGDQKTIVVPAALIATQFAAIDSRRAPARPIAASGIMSR